VWLLSVEFKFSTELIHGRGKLPCVQCYVPQVFYTFVSVLHSKVLFDFEDVYWCVYWNSGHTTNNLFLYCPAAPVVCVWLSS